MVYHETLAYDFLAPPRIVFGWGRRKEVGALARSLGRRAFLITGSRTLAEGGALAEIAHLIQAAGVEPLPIATISHEPEVGDVDRTVALLRGELAERGDLVVALGGGSAIDLAKAAAALVAQNEQASVCDYLEGVGRELTIEATPLPVLAIPTTSGTGSEATKNAVISSYDPPFKKSLRHDAMLPRVVLIDPELTVSLPPAPTAWTGMDAITQLIESYITRKARPIPRALALEGLRLAGSALPEAVRDGNCRPAREAMAQAALLSGMALANSGLGLAHGVAAALGACCRVPHGLACAVMLPAALSVNRRAREPDIARIGETLTGRSWPSPSAAADAAQECIDDLCRTLAIPWRLSEIGVHREQLPQLVRLSRGNSMSGNPVEITDSHLHELLEGML